MNIWKIIKNSYSNMKTKIDINNSILKIRAKGTCSQSLIWMRVVFLFDVFLKTVYNIYNSVIAR